MVTVWQVGDSRIMLSDEWPKFSSPATLGGTTTSLCIYTDNVDEHFAHAIKEGAVETKPVEDQFYGDRSGSFKDPFGHQWTLATHFEDVSPEEMNTRMAAMFGGTLLYSRDSWGCDAGGGCARAGERGPSNVPLVAAPVNVQRCVPVVRGGAVRAAPRSAVIGECCSVSEIA